MKDNKTIFLCVPNYVFSSDMLRTKYIEYLSKNFKVVVISPMVDSVIANTQKYFISDNVVYEKRLIKFAKFWGIAKFFRICWVNEFDYLTSTKLFYKRPNYKNNKLRKLVRFIGLPFSFITTAGFFTCIERLFLPRLDDLLLLYKKYKPVAVITATPGFDSWEAEFIIFAKRIGIPSIAVNFTWDNLTMNCKHIRKTDYLLVWNSIIKDEAINIHKYNENNVLISGILRFDPYFGLNSESLISKEEFLRSKGLNPDYPTIFHTTVTKAYTFQKKYIRDLIDLRRNGFIPYVNLFIRLHPLDNPDNYKEFVNLPDFCIERAGHEVKNAQENLNNYTYKIEMNTEDFSNLRNSLKFTDININYASTISIESCVFDKPIINIGYIGIYSLAYSFNHYKPVLDSGAVRLVKKDEDLAKFINMYLEKPELDSENRNNIVGKYVQFKDGLSYVRSVDLLKKILNNV